jgi:hypothetical protein
MGDIPVLEPREVAIRLGRRALRGDELTMREKTSSVFGTLLSGACSSKVAWSRLAAGPRPAKVALSGPPPRPSLPKWHLARRFPALLRQSHLERVTDPSPRFRSGTWHAAIQTVFVKSRLDSVRIGARQAKVVRSGPAIGYRQAKVARLRTGNRPSAEKSDLERLGDRSPAEKSDFGEPAAGPRLKKVTWNGWGRSPAEKSDLERVGTGPRLKKVTSANPAPVPG